MTRRALRFAQEFYQAPSMDIRSKKCVADTHKGCLHAGLGLVRVGDLRLGDPDGLAWLVMVADWMKLVWRCQRPGNDPGGRTFV